MTGDKAAAACLVNPGVLVHQRLGDGGTCVNVISYQPNMGDLVGDGLKGRFIILGHHVIVSDEPSLGSQ